jgi:hypothetical protein
VAGKSNLPATLVAAYAASELERKTTLAAAGSPRDDEQLSAARNGVDNLSLPRLIADQRSTVADQGMARSILQERLVVRLRAD